MQSKTYNLWKKLPLSFADLVLFHVVRLVMIGIVRLKLMKPRTRRLIVRKNRSFLLRRCCRRSICDILSRDWGDTLWIVIDQSVIINNRFDFFSGAEKWTASRWKLAVIIAFFVDTLRELFLWNFCDFICWRWLIGKQYCE